MLRQLHHQLFFSSSSSSYLRGSMTLLSVYSGNINSTLQLLLLQSKTTTERPAEY